MIPGGNTGSLHARLLSATALIVLCALAVVGFGLVYLFEQHVERRVETELKNHLLQLITFARLAPNGELSVEGELTDPRFRTPYSGLYWQIDGEKGMVATSRSLWDFKLAIDNEAVQVRAVIEAGIAGPQDQTLITLVRRISMNSGSGERSFWFSASLDHREVTSAVREFTVEIALALGVLAAVLLLATWAQVSYGLLPLKRLGRELTEIRRGWKKRFDLEQPEEIAPFVAEMNGLLQQQEAVMERSRTRAASLAHGLKTPMAAIGLEVESLRDRGDGVIASRIEQHLRLMERHVQRELIRARVRGGTHGVRVHTPVAPLARRIVETLRRLPGGRDIDWTVALSDDVSVLLDADDLAEILGNLLDNCRKWARSRVVVSATASTDAMMLSIDDDGPGVAEAEYSRITQWGMRGDETAGGSGLGLAIVRDILNDCGGTLEITRSNLGGLGIRITLPTSRAVSSGDHRQADEMLTADVTVLSGESV